MYGGLNCGICRRSVAFVYPRHQEAFVCTSLGFCVSPPFFFLFFLAAAHDWLDGLLSFFLYFVCLFFLFLAAADRQEVRQFDVRFWFVCVCVCVCMYVCVCVCC